MKDQINRQIMIIISSSLSLNSQYNNKIIAKIIENDKKKKIINL